MIIDIEHAFPTTVCINCWRRPIREGGISRCEECAAEKEIQRMEKEYETPIVDESDPDVADYITHNTSTNKRYVLTENDRLIMSMKDYGQWDDLDVPDQAYHGPENNGSLRD